MQLLTLSDIKLGVGDLLTRRREVVELTQCGVIYLPLLRASYDAIVALPPVVTGKPFAVQLAETDTVHDGYGAAVWYLTEAYLHVPGLDASLRAVVERVREKFVPTLQALNASYADEALAAIERRKLLKSWRADLKRLPVAGGTLYDWIDAQLTAGEKLDELLRTRAGNTPGSRKQASTLRGKVVGQLARFREALRDEREAREDLPEDIEAQLFGYIDQLAAMRSPQSASASEESTDEVTPAAPQPPKQTPSQTPQPA